MATLDWNSLPRPIVALSPMADMTDSAFCRVVKSMASPIVFREMVSSEAVVRGNEKTLGMTDIHPDERPLVQQLFGSDPATMAEAARIIHESHAPEAFDINMGCPVYKIVHAFNGAALMKEPERASAIVKAVSAAVPVPVSVKIRTGWSDPAECLEFAPRLEQAGAALITVHGRTKAQGYSGVSDWDRIAQVKELVSIPVLANGDAHTAPRVIDMLERTGADGAMIARGALGNPWIFAQVNDLLDGRPMREVAMEERIHVVKAHARLHAGQYGERGILTFRKHLSWYFSTKGGSASGGKGIRGARHFREKLMQVSTLAQLDEALEAVLMAP